MATRNKLIEAMSPIITEAQNLEEATKNVAGLIKIAKEFGGYQFTQITEIEKGVYGTEKMNVYGLQLAFTNVEMYRRYLVRARKDGLL